MAEKSIKVAVIVDPSKAASGVKSVSGELDKLGASGEKVATGITGKIGNAFSSMTGKASKSLGGLGGDIGGLGSKMGGLAVPLVGAGTAIAAFALDGAAKFGDLGVAVDKFSKVAGVGNEAASKWIAVADDYGVSADTISGAVGKLGKTLGTNIDALDKYGVKIAYAKDGTVDLTATTLNAADAYNATKDPAERAALGAAAFGKSYMDLIPLIEQGSASIKTSFDGVSKAQTFDDDGKKVAAAQKYKLAMDDLHDSVSDLQMTLGQKLIPTIVQTANAASKLSSAMIWLSDHLPTELFESLETVLNPVAAGIKGLTKVTDDYNRSLMDDTGRKSFDKWLVKELDFLPSFAGEAQVVVSGMADMSKASALNASALEDQYVAFLTARGEATKAAKVIGDTKAYDALTKSLEKQATALLEVGDAMSDSTDKALASQQADLDSATAVDTYNKSLKDGKLTVGEHKQAFLDVEKQISQTSQVYGDYVVNQAKGSGQILTAAEEAKTRTDAQITSLEKQRDTLKPGSALWNTIDGWIEHLKSIPSNIDTSIGVHLPNTGGTGGTTKRFATGTDRVPGMTGHPMLAIVHGGERITPAAMAGASRGGNGGGNTYSITNYVAAGADPVAVGRATVDAIKAYERTSGPGWRN